MDISEAEGFWPEDRTEEDERFLMLEGLVVPRSEPYPGLRVSLGPTGRLCMVGFAYADLPLPATFDVVLDRDDPGVRRDVPAIVVAVTQQYCIPFDVVPRGWRTLCAIDFPLGVPDLVEALPVATSWDYSQATGRVAVCRIAAYEAVSRHLREHRTTSGCNG